MIVRPLLFAAALAALAGCAAPKPAGEACVLGFTDAFDAEKLPGLSAEDRKFMAENAKKPGVCITPAGVQYEVLKAAAPDNRLPRPSSQDLVLADYRGALPDGTEFDSSARNGGPVPLQLAGGVIPGFSDGVPLMRPGEQFRFVIPPHLAYGDRGSPPAIGENQTLVFEVTLQAYQGRDGQTVFAPGFQPPAPPEPEPAPPAPRRRGGR